MIALADRATTLAAGFQEKDVATVPLETPISQAARQALERGETHYSDRPGILPLRENVVNYLQTLGISTTAGNVVITCGVTEARFVAVQVLLARGGVLACAGDVDAMRGAALLRGADVVAVNSPEDIPETASALYVTDKQLAGWLEHTHPDNLWFIIELTGHASSLAIPPALAARTIMIANLGAAHGVTPWRVGFLAVLEGDIGTLRGFKQALTICSTNVSQWAASALASQGLVSRG